MPGLSKEAKRLNFSYEMNGVNLKNLKPSQNVKLYDMSNGLSPASNEV